MKRLPYIYFAVVASVSKENPGELRFLLPEHLGEDPSALAVPVGMPGANKGNGFWWLPKVGAVVCVAFRGGDPNQPMYWHGPWASPGGVSEVPDDAKADPSGVKLLETDKFLMVFDDTAEEFRMLDKTTGTQFFTNGTEVFHDIKVPLRIVVEGDVTLDATGDLTATIEGDATIHSDQDVLVEADGDATVSAMGNAELSADGNVLVDAGGTMDVNSVSAMNINSQGPITVHSDTTVTIDGGTNVLVNGALSVTVTATVLASIQATLINFNGAAGDVVTTATHPFDYITGIPILGIPNVKAGGL